MKRFLVVAATLALIALSVVAFPPRAHASNCAGYPYTLTNGQTADATQVMANFNGILSCANANLAHNGANSDITGLSGMLTPLSLSQGGTGFGTAAGFRTLLPFEFYVFVGGTTGNTWNLGAYVPSTDVVLTTAASACKVGTAATGSTTYTLKDNGVSIGTAVIGAASTTCTATITSSPYTLTAGHSLTLVGPATGDATAADVGITFGGTRG